MHKHMIIPFVAGLILFASSPYAYGYPEDSMLREAKVLRTRLCNPEMLGGDALTTDCKSDFEVFVIMSLMGTKQSRVQLKTLQKGQHRDWSEKNIHERLESARKWLNKLRAKWKNYKE